MLKNELFERRSFIQRIGAVGTALVVAGCEDLPDDAGNDPTPTAISFGETAEGEITKESPSDPVYGDPAESFPFTAAAGDIIDVTMESQEMDGYLIVVGPNGSSQGENDDYGTTSDSRVIRELQKDGEYTIWAQSAYGDENGSFTLSFSRGSRNLLVPDTATNLSTGDRVEGTLRNDSPYDPLYGDPGQPYTFEGSEGDSVSVRMDSEDVDPFLIITDDAGYKVAQNDDGGEGTNSSVTTTFSESGTYVIWGQSVYGDEEGEFTISLS